MFGTMPESDTLSTECLREMINDTIKVTPGWEKQAQHQMGKDEFLHYMTVSTTRAMMGVPLSFVIMWAGKQDWPLTWLQCMDVNAAWWKQLIEWRKQGGME